MTGEEGWQKSSIDIKKLGQRSCRSIASEGTSPPKSAVAVLVVEPEALSNAGSNNKGWIKGIDLSE